MAGTVLNPPLSPAFSLPTILRRKTRTAWNEAVFRGVNLVRPLGDRAIRSVADRAQMTGRGLILVEGLWDHPYHWLRAAMMRNALQDRASGMLGLYEENAPARVRRSLRNLGLQAEVCVPAAVAEKYFTEARRLLADCSSARSILDLKLPLDFPAHHLYDGALKREEIGTLDAGHPRLATYLARLLCYLSFYEELFAQHNVSVVITSHPNFPQFAAMIWCALRRGIPVYYTIHVNEHVAGRRFLEIADYQGNLSDRPSPEIRDTLSGQQRQLLIAQGRDYYAKIRGRQIGQFSILDIYGSAKGDDRGAFMRAIGADPAKRNVVILTSCWSDGPNGGGPSHFTDYQDLLEKTLSTIARVKTCNWILRPHPAEFMYGDKMRLGSLVAGRLPDNAHLWPDGFGGNAIPAVADCVVTPAGTSGIEYAALGVPTLVCRDTAYTPWEFVHWARDARDFDDKLARAAELAPPTERQREDAFIFLAMTFMSPPETRDSYLYQWGSRSWWIWPSLPSFVQTNRGSIEREIAMLRRWIASPVDSYNVYKWLNRESW